LKQTRASTDSSALAGQTSAGDQAEAFESAVELFRQREFSRARLLFDRAIQGPNVEIAHAAQMHVRMCDRRLGAGSDPQNPEDQYNFGIALVNQGRTEEAVRYLRAAVAAKDQAGHYHYALALCLALQGDLQGSAVHLRRAIQIEPGNRIAALNDPDFHRIGGHPALRELLNGERNDTG
jgi:tetratricopeptide (TPR) repeat protein